ncbi:uncharacterized protein LOC116851797 [Odontomachus brunneus]|uniref:uncharacterized protein LOC116851797 n=1 Tax=Odontomachus brunneus TaxID=486640 RepID=UPI0013F28AE3|nr:uncharacterized protein LOC116851797 [Odontomachus brunneus]
MKPHLKLSTSRKLLHKLSMRQRNKVMSEIRRNLHLQNSAIKSKRNVEHVESNDNSELQHLSPLPECSSSNYFPSINENIASTSRGDIEDDRASCSSSISSNVSYALFSSFSSLSELSFTEILASCFVDSNTLTLLTHNQGNSVLAILRTHTCFINLPKDVRTLLNTPRHRVVLCTVEPGEYIHFDLEIALVESLCNAPFVSRIGELELDFNTDGCTLDKSGTVQIWPIQCRISNLHNTKPIIVGIYKGAQKPYDATALFEKFIADVKTIFSNGGINFRDNLSPMSGTVTYGAMGSGVLVGASPTLSSVASASAAGDVRRHFPT